MEGDSADLAQTVATAQKSIKPLRCLLVPGVGQKAAMAAVSEAARKRARDLADYVAQLQAYGVTSLRGLAEALNANEIETPRGWGPGAVQCAEPLGPDRLSAGHKVITGICRVLR
jgi:hypothetical protein